MMSETPNTEVPAPDPDTPPSPIKPKRRRSSKIPIRGKKVVYDQETQSWLNFLKVYENYVVARQEFTRMVKERYPPE